MKRKSILLILVVMMFGSACQENSNEKVSPPGQPIQVQFATDPETQIVAGQSVTLSVQVTQEGEYVDDADEVMFEIWLSEEEEEKGGEHEGESDSSRHDHEERHDSRDQQDQSHPSDRMDEYETEHEMLEAIHQGEGIYTLQTSFAEAGVYQVMYHVTARDYHAMRAHEIAIGP